MVRAGRIAILVLAGFWLAPSCSGPELEGGAPSFGDGLRGEVEVRVVDHFDGTGERQCRLVGEDGKSRRLAFGRDPDLAPGTRVTVWGDDEGAGCDEDAVAAGLGGRWSGHQDGGQGGHAQAHGAMIRRGWPECGATNAVV